MNVKVFNLMSGAKETIFLVQHESCEFKCGLNERVCNSKQRWNHSKCQWECKELDDWGSCGNDYMWNSSTDYCEYNKTCKIDEYLDIRNCSCEKRLIWKLVLDEILNTYEILLHDKKDACAKSSCLIHTVLLVITNLLLLALTCVSCYFYFTKYWSKQKHLLPFNATIIKLRKIWY